MVKRFFSQAWLYHKARTAAFDWREFLFFDTGYPIITLVFYCLLAAYSFQTTDLTHWVIGNSFLMCVNTCIFGLGSLFRSERYSGRLRSIIAAPCNLFSVVLSYGFIPSILAMGSVVLGFVVGAVVFGIDFTGVNLGLAMLTIFCAMICASCFGLLLSVFGLVSDGMHLILNMMNYIPDHLCGTHPPCHHDQPGLGHHGTELPSQLVCAGIPGVSYHGVRGYLLCAGAEHWCWR